MARCACGLAMALVLAGCSRSPMVEVTGTVKLNGDPLPGAVITFVSEAASGRPAAARTDAQGHYSLATYFKSEKIVPGALPDDYRVSIAKYLRPNLKRAALHMSALSNNMAKVRRYMEEESAEDLWPEGVPAGWPRGYIPGVTGAPLEIRNDLDAYTRLLRLANGMSLVPRKYANFVTSGLSATVERVSGGPLVLDFDIEGKGESPDDNIFSNNVPSNDAPRESDSTEEIQADPLAPDKLSKAV